MDAAPLAERLPSEGYARAAAAAGATFLCALLGWSALAEVDVVVTVPAVARTDQGTLELRAPMAGRVAGTQVSAGDTVVAGQPVLTFDATLMKARQQTAHDALSNRRRQLAEDRRVRALLDGQERDAESAGGAAYLRVRAHRGRMARLDDDLRALESELRAARARADAARSLLDIAAERYQAAEQGLDAGAMSRFEWLRARQEYEVQVAESDALRSQVTALEQRLQAQRHARTAAEADFRESLLRSIASLELEVIDLTARLADAAENLRLTTVVAPRAGAADRLLVKPGDFVERGEALAVIVPTDSPVYFEARVAPRQTAFLFAGQPCRIKLDALPFARYGAVSCMLEALSRDVASGEEGGHYLARVRPAAQNLLADGQAVALQPGATGWVDILAGERTVLGFFTEPLQRFAAESLRER